MKIKKIGEVQITASFEEIEELAILIDIARHAINKAVRNNESFVEGSGGIETEKVRVILGNVELNFSGL